MSEFFDKLRIDRKLEESLRLCNDIENRDLRDRLRTLIALNFSAGDPGNELLASILGVQFIKHVTPEVKIAGSEQSKPPNRQSTSDVSTSVNVATN